MRRHPKVEDETKQLPGGGTVFGIGRRRTEGQLARAELNQGIGHLRLAATHAAKGAGSTVGPRVQTARDAVAPTAVMVRDRAASGLAATAAAMAPLALAVRHAQAEAAGRAAAGRKAVAKQAAAARKVKAKNMKMKRKKSRRSGTMMAGLLAAGVVAGLAGAVALRRHREQREWTEYDARTTLEPMRDEVETVEVRTAAPAGAAKASTGSGSSAVAAGDSASTTAPAKPSPVTPTDKVPSVAEGARTTSGRPADDLSTALSKAPSKSNGRA
ncbi:hypothetical protein [Micromonospora craniellae]|uniref:Uncharacterized protein n=1 Tax=Micromonospora craniellae TaxID=2294034 RepID=A0A372FZI2_9ACTN|nr:hypothetical protein [Micromonospora craniellae]QOC94439.1 hypothetical protein ID554_13195 [Micromonospora craniellae]RFS46182.1 hypothetical protein D0Q02_13470 [Micromonospora craniellae]